jgi:hypothetical protein
VLAFIVYRLPAIRWCWLGVVLTMAVLGLLATWISAQRARRLE